MTKEIKINQTNKVKFKPLEPYENKSILQDDGEPAELLKLFEKQYKLAENGLPNFLNKVVEVMENQK
jgi:hypothetical protein